MNALRSFILKLFIRYRPLALSENHICCLNVIERSELLIVNHLENLVLLLVDDVFLCVDDDLQFRILLDKSHDPPVKLCLIVFQNAVQVVKDEQDFLVLAALLI
mmetsp:Transcript_26828/g.25879  ORF Transcript_26828/g.25879 Transcript_26828/m.25879 type:complete len:104 (+) Transcript_26828:496-807(+)